MADRTFRNGDIELAATVEGPPDGPPVLLLHGGGQTRHAWGGTTAALGRAGWLAVAVDLRGHGDSSWSTIGYGNDVFADDIRVVARELGRPAIIGASLGGLAALVARGEDPRVDCSALILVDVAPSLERAGTERIQAFMTAKPEGFGTLEEAAEAVAAYRRKPSRGVSSGLSKNLRLMEDGRYHWHWDPTFMSPGPGRARGMDVERLNRAAGSLQVPTLLVYGGTSDVVSESSVEQFVRVVPSADLVRVDDAGHMVAGDQNDAFTDAIVAFLRRTAG
jgi:non-heme chloroperoxidase